MAGGDDDDATVEVVRDYRREDESGRIERVRVLRVPESEAYPDGVKYALHYGTVDGDTLLRYDNAHGVHERHTPNGTTEIEYPGIATLYRRFREEISDL